MGFDVAYFTDARLKFYLKAVQRQTPNVIKLNKIIDISMLTQIVEQCDYTYSWRSYKVR